MSKSNIIQENSNQNPDDNKLSKDYSNTRESKQSQTEEKSSFFDKHLHKIQGSILYAMLATQITSPFAIGGFLLFVAVSTVIRQIMKSTRNQTISKQKNNSQNLGKILAGLCGIIGTALVCSKLSLHFNTVLLIVIGFSCLAAYGIFKQFEPQIKTAIRTLGYMHGIGIPQSNKKTIIYNKTPQNNRTINGMNEQNSSSMGNFNHPTQNTNNQHQGLENDLNLNKTDFKNSSIELQSISNSNIKAPPVPSTTKEDRIQASEESFSNKN